MLQGVQAVPRKVATRGSSCLIFFSASHVTRAEDASEGPEAQEKCLLPSVSLGPDPAHLAWPARKKMRHGVATF